MIQIGCVGDLLQLVLIQIQKTKVDLAVAMAALDRLLRANQLNFALLAMIPSAMLLHLTWVWLWQRGERQQRRRALTIKSQLRQSLR